MTEFRFLNSDKEGEVITNYVATASGRLSAANFANVRNSDACLEQPEQSVREHLTTTDPDAGKVTERQHAIRAQIERLTLEHRNLDHEVARRLDEPGPGDELLLRRLKKHKLQLKDRLTVLQMQLEPDILA